MQYRAETTSFHNRRTSIKYMYKHGEGINIIIDATNHRHVNFDKLTHTRFSMNKTKKKEQRANDHTWSRAHISINRS